MLNFEQIKELIELVADRKLSGMELERSGFRLKIDGHFNPPPVVASAPVAAAPIPVAAASAPVAAAPGEAALAAAPAPAAPPPVDDSHILTSPIVGTYYSAPSPGTPPFVEVGSRVAKGQVVCIVEAMKLMNEIEADVSGVIVEIFPKNAQPVEYGEKLYAIRAD